jgi:hypothetical protein
VPAHSKVQDKQEAILWLEDGKTYQWIVDEYRRKYQIETTISMWAALRRRHGLNTRIVRDEALIPWAVKPEHRHAHAVSMLRAEARKRAGKTLTPLMAQMLETWLRGLKDDERVVHYDPSTAEGWSYVPRREGIDKDLIRVPVRKTGRGNWATPDAEAEESSNGNITVAVTYFDEHGNSWPG